MYNIYEHTFPNGKKYIGITKQEPEDRWGIDGYNYKTQLVYNAILKYGWDNIQHNIIATGLTKEEACQAEKFFIQWYNTTDKNNGYNCTTGGDSVYTVSQETRQKLHNSHIGQKQSEKCKQAILKAHTGVQRNQETKDKISSGRIKYLKTISLTGANNPFYGKHHSEEAKEKNRIAHIGKPSGHTFKAELINIETGEILTFNKQSEISKFLNVSQSLVSKSIKNGKQIRNYNIRRI